MKDTMKDIFYQHMIGKVSFEYAKEQVAVCLLEQSLQQAFDRAIEAHDSEMVELLLILPSWYGIQSNFLHYYSTLLSLPWHYGHEWLIEVLRKYKYAGAVECIHKAIEGKFNYLVESGNYESFVRKCLWALEDIGSEESLNLLQNLANHSDITIKQHAITQFKRIADNKQARYMG